MKTEDDPSSDFITSVPPVSAAISSSSTTPSPPADAPESAAPVFPDDLVSTSSSSAAAAAAARTAGSPSKPLSRKKRDAKLRDGKKKDPDVCDFCRERRIKCDYKSPCKRCLDANIPCRRTYVPQKRGPKKGQGKVINAIRERERQEAELNSAANAPRQDAPWRANAVGEPRSAFTTDQYQPIHRPYLQLIPRCVELYYEHIYPIMPLLYLPAIRSMVQRSMTDPEKNLIYALCAMVCLHMSGKSLHVDGPESWEDAGCFFLNECVSTRTKYDYMEDNSLGTVISSFWLSTSFFEINQDRKSWRYLREALTFAEDMGLHDNATYVGLSPEEALCRQRVFWILFVTERSFAVLRKRPLTFKKTPSLPTTRHAYESPDIHTGFLQLVSSYTPLDESFVSAWNDDSDPRVSATTYLALQNLLAQPPTFLQRSRASTPSSEGNPTYSAPVTAAPSMTGSDEEADEEIVHSEPTAIQKADLLITQQWLRLIVWQSSSKQQLLSWNAPHESMSFAFPLEIARSTANVLQSLPSSAVEVHGMGIFEKIFEIGNTCMRVLDYMDQSNTPRSAIGGMPGAIGMDFIGTGDLGVLSLSRRGVATDPFEVFVRTLSATPNSRLQFANPLLTIAQQRPGVMKMALTPSLANPVHQPEAITWSTAVANVSNSLPMIEEVVKEETDLDTAGNNGWSIGNSLSLDAGASAPSLLSDTMLDFNTSPFPVTSTNAPDNSRQSVLTSLSMPSLDTSMQPVSTWGNEMSAATEDWSYDLTSPTLDSTAFSNNPSAYNSAAGTPLGNFSLGTATFTRQNSGDNNAYQYHQQRQQQQQPTYGGMDATGAGSANNSNNSMGREHAKRAHQFFGNIEWPTRS